MRQLAHIHKIKNVGLYTENTSRRNNMKKIVLVIVTCILILVALQAVTNIPNNSSHVNKPNPNLHEQIQNMPRTHVSTITDNRTMHNNTTKMYPSKVSALLQFIESRHISYDAAVPKSIQIPVNRNDNFAKIMQNVGIPFFATLTHDNTSHTWVSTAVFWWKKNNYQSVSVQTLSDIIRFQSRVSYRTFAENFMNGSYITALKALSATSSATDAVPGVAVFRRAFISKYGRIQNNSHTLYSTAVCKSETFVQFNTTSVPVFEIVITIAQYWGSEYFHFIAENLVRISTAFEILKQKENSKLHIQTPQKFMLEILTGIGIKEKQLTTGNVFANFAVVPEPIPCGTPPASLLHMTRNLLVSNNPYLFNIPETKSCKILFIKRKHTRRISNYEELLRYVVTSFPKCSVKVHTGDEAMTEQMSMFRQANIILAAHGAGLANIIVCRQKALIFEFLISGRDLNLCYMTMAYKLHLRYISITIHDSSQSNSMTVNVQNAIDILQKAHIDAMTY